MITKINTPNLNLAKSTNYKFVIHAIPNTSFWLTTANIPTISANEVPIPDPVHGYKYLPTNTIMWAPLTLTFLVDENFDNYHEIFKWMSKAAGPEIEKRDKDVANLMTTASLHILSNNKNVSETVFTFHDMFPTILGELQFNNESSEELITDITIQYTHMSMEKGLVKD